MDNNTDYPAYNLEGGWPAWLDKIRENRRQDKQNKITKKMFDPIKIPQLEGAVALPPLPSPVYSPSPVPLSEKLPSSESESESEPLPLPEPAPVSAPVPSVTPTLQISTTPMTVLKPEPSEHYTKSPPRHKMGHPSVKPQSMTNEGYSPHTGQIDTSVVSSSKSSYDIPQAEMLRLPQSATPSRGIPISHEMDGEQVVANIPGAKLCPIRPKKYTHRPENQRALTQLIFNGNTDIRDIVIIENEYAVYGTASMTLFSKMIIKVPLNYIVDERIGVPWNPGPKLKKLIEDKINFVDFEFLKEELGGGHSVKFIVYII